MKIINGFTFNDFCQPCGKVTEHKIATSDSNVLGICSSCKLQRPLTELKQVSYPKTDLWVTRFRIGNLDSVVTGKLVDSIEEVRK